MLLHHGLTDLCGNHFTDSFILAWFQASSQASLRVCLWAPLTSKQQLTAGCSLTPQHSACALLSDHGYLLIQAFFQALQSYSWGLVLIQSLSKQQLTTTIFGTELQVANCSGLWRRLESHHPIGTPADIKGCATGLCQQHHADSYQPSTSTHVQASQP